MAASALQREVPATREEAASVLARAAADGAGVRIVGGGTKHGWGPLRGDPGVELSTAALERIVAHDAGDMTAILEAGVPLARAQGAFAEAGQRLALDPPLGAARGTAAGGGATIGGVLASADSGPLRSRYGSARDLVLGATVALSDGTLAKSGGTVIKNVAGYDLAKLFAGSFGTLGLIVQVAVRLHPLPGRTLTATGSSDDASALAVAAAQLSHAALEHEGLDIRFGGGEGSLLGRFCGAAPEAQAETAVALMEKAGLTTAVVEDDDAIWGLQRSSQRSENGAVVRVSGLQTQLAGLLRLCESLGARMVGRVPLGLSYVRIEGHEAEGAAAAIEELRQALSPSPCAVLDAPAELRSGVDPWPIADPGGRALMERVRERFDPSGVMSA
jgi:glycolate oxidase FAD binding subunit